MTLATAQTESQVIRIDSVSTADPATITESASANLVSATVDITSTALTQLKTAIGASAGVSAETTRAEAAEAACSQNVKQGTVQLNGATPVAVACASITANNFVVLTLTTVAGTQGKLPAVTVTPSTGFSVVGTASDTSTYTYRVI